MGSGMGFRIEDYEALRPYVYHTAPVGNTSRILAKRCLEPTSALLEQGGRGDLLCTRRERDLALTIDGYSIVIRDQKPLVAANIEFEAGWGLAELVECINGRVFFWPGGLGGPIEYGATHFERYASERPVVLRIKLRSLLAENPGLQPQFSRYNSGAARQNQGKRIPRGPNTFTAAGRFGGTPGDVKEVAFAAPVRLPDDSESSSSLRGPWRRALEQLQHP
jgi:hypothetical protein